MNRLPDLDSSLQAAADAIRSAEALLIGAGAGMGVDSGLPDFRGPEGFWKAYPPFHGQKFSDISTPHWFATDPALAWGFFGHRMDLYRAAVPHRGFDILRRWGESRPFGVSYPQNGDASVKEHSSSILAAKLPCSLEVFVFTSNVDGQFQKAGFSEEGVVERHGSIHYLQCAGECGRAIWSANNVAVDVDEVTIRARSEYPTCPDCGAIARPNILMFDDWEWQQARYAEQRGRYENWLRRVQEQRVVAVELGAGLAIPTVRNECLHRGQVLIRINPREADAPPGGISLPLGALEALEIIGALLETGPR